MRKLKTGFRSGMAWLLTLAMIIVMTPSAIFAEEVTAASYRSSWSQTTLADITASDAVAITMTTKDGATYALPSATNTGGSPTATAASVTDTTMTIEAAGAVYSWYITANEDGTYAIKNADGGYLYTTAANNGVRIGSTEMNWTLDQTTGYLSAVDSAEKTRYLGVYTTTPDWRAYTSTTGNTKEQTLHFWKFTGDETIEETPVEEVTDIEKLTPTATYTGTVTAGTEMTLQCGTISDATYEISTDNTTWTALEGTTYTVPEGDPGDYTLYIRGVKDQAYSQVLTLTYTIKAAASVTATLTDELNDGDVVYIYSNSSSTVLTGTAAGTEAKPTLAASDTAVTDSDKLSVTDDMLALQVEKTEVVTEAAAAEESTDVADSTADASDTTDATADTTADTTDATADTSDATADSSADAAKTYTYAFHTIDGRYLTSGATGNALTLGAKTEYSTWTLEELTVNDVTAYTLKSVNAKYNETVQALEYYKAFTTYSTKSTAAYQFSFYKLDATEGVTDISAARALAADETPTVQGIVTYVSGKNVYVQDWTGGICLYFSTAPTDVAVGDIVKATGKKTSYKGLEELTSVTDYEVTGKASVLPCTTVTLDDLTADYAADNALECTRVYLADVTLGTINASGNTPITDAAGNTINVYKSAAFADRTAGDEVSLYAVVSDFNGYQLFVTAASDVTLIKSAATTPTESESATEAATEESSDSGESGSGSETTQLPATIADGTYVIWNPNYNISLANETNSSGYYIGDAVTGDTNEAANYTNASLWKVTAVDGGYTFEQNGLYLGTTSGNKVTIAAEPANKVWTIALTEDGQYYNISCNGYFVEWYSKYSDWSTYSKVGSDATLFAIWFTPAQAVYDTDADLTMGIAQWGGGGPYEADILSVPGDAYEAGDQKDATATFTALVNGTEVKPFTTGTSSTTGITNYYMGATGLGSGTNDYAQFALSTAGYGDLSMSFRLRASNTGSGEYQVQYSTDGTAFKNLTTGSYSCSYTQYNSDGTSAPVSLSGDITDGIAKTSIKATSYITFSFDLPAGAENAKNLYIRLVPSTTVNAKGSGAPTSGGTLRVDNVVVKGAPIVDESITGYVTVDPDGVEEDQTPGTELTMTTKTEGAAILYRFVDVTGNGSEEWLTYDASAKPVLPDTLPAVLQIKATCEGKADSIVRTFTYAAGTCASVKVNPNGGGVYIEAEDGSVTVTLSCETEGATIYYNTDGSDTYAVYDADTTPITLNKGFESLTVKAYAVKEGFNDSSVSTRKFTERSQETYNIYFGQMHSHTSYSDGAGTADDAFKHASGVENLDFLAVTDHSNSFDNADKGVLADDASEYSEEWKEGKSLAKEYTTDHFVGLFGFEMTWSNGLGHINTFNTPGFQSRTQSAYTTYSTALQNYYATLETVSDSVSQFNHPGTTFGDFSDFAYFDEQIDQLITLIEVGNGEGTIGSSSYFPSYEYYTRALDKGWHVAPTNNQDNHKGLWGDANTARSVVLADNLTEDEIYDAMRNYRVYATEDNDLSIYYTLDGNIMGTILTKDDVDDTVTLKANISDPTDSSIGKVEVIVNGGLSIASTEVTGSSDEVTFNVGADYSYYYLKITEADGDIAVTAPVWVGTVEAVGISGLSTTAALQVQDEAIDLNLDLYNNETKPLEISKIEFSVMNADDETTVIKTLEGDDLTAAGLTKVSKLGTASYSFDYTYSGLGKAIYTATVTGTLNGVEKVYSEKLELNYVSSDMVTNVVIDGSHYNDYVTGYYGGNMSNFTALAADEAVKITIAGEDKDASDRSLSEEEWKALLDDCALLIISAPARNSGTANAGNYTSSTWEDWFVDLVADYVKNGGSVAICGLADYQDTKASDADHNTAAQMNKLLAAMGSTMTLNDDEAYDGTNNGGQAYRLYPESFNLDSEEGQQWLSGLVTKEASPDNYQKYSQYSGCTVNPGEGTWLVKGFDTTFSVDSDKDGVGALDETESVSGYNYNKVVSEGNATILAVEDTAAGGHIFAAGGVFVSDFEVDYEVDNIYDLPYANTTIAKNILSSVKVELPVSDIATVRAAANAGESGSVFRIQGTVTVGRSNENNAFFDCIYVQDETGGIDIFPISDDTIQVGASIEITGYIASYQGDLELKVMSYKLLDNENLNPIAPTALTCKEASDYAANGGLLTSVTGTVKEGSLYYNADGTLAQFVVTDETGETTIFIDGYILSGTTGENVLADTVKAGATVTAVGVQYMHPEVFVPGVTENVSVLRVRDCDEITVSADKPAEQKEATITAKNVVKTLSSKKQTVKLNVTTNSDGKITYTSNSRYVKVSSDGTVTIAKRFAGKATITIKTAETDAYKAATKKITVTVKVPSPKIKTVVNKKTKKLYATWTKVSAVDGYRVQISTSKSFKVTRSVTFRNVNKTNVLYFRHVNGKKYYIHVRAYRLIDGKRVYSDWSSVKSIKMVR